MDNEWFETYGYPPFYEDIRMYEMDDHDLLIKIEERTRNIWRVVEKQEAHQEEANGFIRDNMKQTAKNSAWLMAIKWVVGLLVLGVGACITGYLGVW